MGRTGKVIKKNGKEGRIRKVIKKNRKDRESD